MEFDDRQDLEEEEEEEEGDEEEEEEMRPTAPASAPTKNPSSGGWGEAAGSSTAAKKSSAPVRYRECQKNHAVGIGGHAVDGCWEFMAAGEEGSLDALKCAACNCHRNFHRKEVDPRGGGAAGELIPYHHPPPPPPPPQFSPYHYRGPPPPHIHFSPAPDRPLALPATAAAGSGGGGGGGNYSREEEDVSNPSSSGGGGGMNTSYKKKRHRTKFTGEQKEMMRRLSERLGWRIQKHDEAAVEQFCSETGIKRKVLKVWMHNNKNTIGKEP